jgi:hypothetical protein
VSGAIADGYTDWKAPPLHGARHKQTFLMGLHLILTSPGISRMQSLPPIGQCARRLHGLLKGANFGKQLVRVGPDKA